MKNTVNYEKYYAIYHRFNSLLNEKKQLYRLRTINFIEIKESIANEFGYSSISSIEEILTFVQKNRNSPYIQKAAILFEENRKNYFQLYNKKEDLENIERIEKKIKKTKSTKTAFTFYFIYKRYNEMLVEGLKKTDAYYELSDEFYYTNSNSIRNIIRQVKDILCETTTK